jgi:hypothetical protein
MEALIEMLLALRKQDCLVDDVEARENDVKRRKCGV